MTSSHEFAIQAPKDIEDAPYYCGYLMQPPTEGILEIKVVDTGCGMTSEEKEKLFKPFSQANKTVYSSYGGTGLGLWISYKLITAMKGDIKCESGVGTGSCFTVTIPARTKVEKEVEKVLE